MGNAVVYLCPRERVSLDPNRLGVLYAELGGVKVQEVLERAMQEMVLANRDLRVLYDLQDFVGFLRRLRSLMRVAEHMGLNSIVRVVGDVADCVEQGDPTAIAATWARLSRAMEQVMIGNWSEN